MADIRNLAECVEDIRLAGLDQDEGPPEPLPFHALRGRLQTARPRISSLYREVVLDPFAGTLDQLNESDFNQILLQDPQRERAGGMMMDIAQAILQRGEGTPPRGVAAFQEVVSDLYDGFLSVEDRAGIEPPDLATAAAMVKFGNPAFGPYTWPADATQIFGLKAAIVSLPPSNARRGLLAWAALGHETAGHDVLHADRGLMAETIRAVRSALNKDASTRHLAPYWSARIDETASDVLGILNMGPAAGIGLIGLFRGLNLAFGGSATLRNNGPASDVHPADVLRGFLAASVVRLLEFKDSAEWADIIDNETLKDVTTIRLEGQVVPTNVARKSAEIVARTLVTHPMSSLEDHAFGEIQNWRDEDEDIANQLGVALTMANPLAIELAGGFFAAHLVAAATTASLQKGANIPMLFGRMLDLLKAMHERNPSFSPLVVRHPGDLARDRMYIPQPAAAAAPVAPSEGVVGV